MQYTPLEVSMAAALSAPNSQAGTSNSQTPPQVTTAASVATADPIYSTAPPITTSVQDGYGMPPDFFSTPPKTQLNASATQPMTTWNDPSATQPMGSQQNASAA